MRIVRTRRIITRPFITVVIPCYNYGHFLPQAVGSALGQADVDVEVIIVDDASLDNSAEVARNIEATEARVSVVIHEVNLGHIATYNDGLSRARGDYVVLLSADDMLAPGSLARSAALLQAHPDVSLVYGYAPSFEDEIPTTSAHVRSWTIWTGDQWIRHICKSGRNAIVNPEAMVRRDVMELTGGYDPNLPHSADMLLWMQAGEHGKIGRINGPDQAYYRIHGQNMHAVHFGELAQDIRERARVFDIFFGSARPPMANSDELLKKAKSALAKETFRAHAVGAFRGTAADSADQRSLSDLLRDLTQGGGHGQRSNDARLSHFWIPRLATATMGRVYLRFDALKWSLKWRLWRRYGL